jgi:precorrin-6B methylase 2
MSTSVSTHTPASPAVTPERILQMAWGYAPPLILEAAIKHRVFDVLDEGPKSVAEIAQATNTSKRGLSAILNALVGFCFLSKDAHGKYALTEESSTFLVSSKPAFHGGFVRHASEHLIPQWLHLNEIVATGKPSHSVNEQQDGSDFFENFVIDILPLSYPAAQALARHASANSTAKFHVLDLAAGSGVWGIAQAQSSPHVHVTAVDWPGVIPVTRRTVARFGVADRFSFVEGDLRDADFGTGYQLATLGHILHSEGEARSRALIAKTFAALASGGTIAIQEFLVNADRTGPINGLLFAINMLVNTDDGDTFSFEEISSWLLEAGFTNPRKLEVPGPSPLILASKP